MHTFTFIIINPPSPLPPPCRASSPGRTTQPHKTTTSQGKRSKISISMAKPADPLISLQMRTLSSQVPNHSSRGNNINSTEAMVRISNMGKTTLNSNSMAEHTRNTGNKATISTTKATVSNRISTRGTVDSSSSNNLLSNPEYL